VVANRRPQLGLTLVELMISLLLVAVVAAFTFGIQIRGSHAFRDDAQVAELQQTLRAASDLLERDIRQAGYHAKALRTALLAGGTVSLLPLAVRDNPSGDGTDIVELQYADESAIAHVTTGGPAWDQSGAIVDSLGGLQTNDVVMAVRTRECQQPGGAPPIPVGGGCILQLTPPASGTNIQYLAGYGVFNAPGNNHCTQTGFDLSVPSGGVGAGSPACWTDGYNVVSRAVLRAYRIKPADPRGVLQMSPTRGLQNDWVDLAFGVVDLQIAVRVYEPASGVDPDGDGDPLRNWYSGPAMNAAVANPANQPLQLAFTLVAKTVGEVSSASVTRTPDVLEAAQPIDYNKVGNHPGTDLPVTDPASPFFGNHLYRWYTVRVDLRNLGIGL
jgi:prepilin-type N-terminal cleavage/methylation domain-containing protein